MNSVYVCHTLIQVIQINGKYDLAIKKRYILLLITLQGLVKVQSHCHFGWCVHVVHAQEIAIMKLMWRKKLCQVWHTNSVQTQCSTQTLYTPGASGGSHSHTHASDGTSSLQSYQLFWAHQSSCSSLHLWRLSAAQCIPQFVNNPQG